MGDVSPVPALDLPGPGQSQQGRVSPSCSALQHWALQNGTQTPETTQTLGKDPTAGKLGRSHSLLHSLRHRPGDGVKKSETAELCSFLLGRRPKVLLSSWTVIKHLVAVPCLQPAARASLALLTCKSLGGWSTAFLPFSAQINEGQRNNSKISWT